VHNAHPHVTNVEPRFLAPRLPVLGDDPPARPYGATSDESVVVGELLMRSVPALTRGDLEIVAIARRRGVLSKVAVRRRPGVRLTARPVSLVVGLGADYVNRVSAELGGERIHVLQWQGDPARYIPAALGIGYLPAIELSSSGRRATVMLGAIDVRGARGRQGINLMLASALTDWRIHLREIARAAAWKVLEAALAQSQSVPAIVNARVAKGLAVTIYGLHGLLPIGQIVGVRRSTPPREVDTLTQRLLGTELQVIVLKLDPDEGHIFVAARPRQARQLSLL
jgi:transcription antitermination factor NusA-like protein